MSIRTNPMKAVPLLQRRLTSVKSKEEPHISDKLDRLMADLIGIKDLFSTVKRKEDELLDTLKIVDDLLRNFRTEKFFEISHRILHPVKATHVDPRKGSDEPSSSQEAQEKSGQKDETIHGKMENLKSMLDNLKANFSTLKKNEELREKLREVENFLQYLNSKLAEDAHKNETTGLEHSIQTSRKEEMNQDFTESSLKGTDKSSSSLKAQDKKNIVEKDTSIDKKFESFKSKLDKMKTLSSTVKENEEFQTKLRIVIDLVQNFKAKNLSNTVKPIEDSNQSEIKSLELPRQKSRDESLDQDFKAIGVDKPSSSQEIEDKKSEAKNVPIDEELESLKLELEKMKAMFFADKEDEDLRDTLRTLEDFLQKYDEKSLVEIVKPVEVVNQSETKGLEKPSQTSGEKLVDQDLKATGIDKPSSSQEAQDKESMEKDVSIDEKVESLKSKIDNKMKKLLILNKNELPNLLRVIEDLLKNTNEKTLDENVKRVPKDEVVDEVVETISKKIKESTKKLGVSEIETKSNESLDQEKTSKIVHYPILSLSRDHKDVELVLKRFQASYDALNPHSKVCCLSLSIFPENVVIKKRHIIYWWIGEGFVRKSVEKTAEEEGEDAFDELLNSNLIVAHMVECPIVNKFKINPWIRHMLVSSVLGENKQPFGFYSQIITTSHHHDSQACLVLDQQKVEIGDEFDSKSDHWRSIFNLGAGYVNIGPQWMAKMKKLVVLQLGRWQESPSHHIEVDNIDFMTDSKAQKHLKYLSLRGISRISELPKSIAQLVSLQILDLKACHNLETLPIEITSLKKLTHLDVSQCYLLERMPKGIEKLTELQVLKGFVVGSSNKTPRISDLVNFTKLKRLSIHIGSEAMVQENEFESLSELAQVKCLKISWGVSSNTKYKDIDIFLPQGLEKLSLEGFPNKKNPKWLKLNNLPRGLRRLYIIGGKLTSIENEKNSRIYCNVEILRLKYLRHFEIDFKSLKELLKELFPSLKYAEVKQVSNYFFEWSIKENTPIA